MKSKRNVIANLVLIICSIMVFCSCEELEETLDEINNELENFEKNNLNENYVGRFNGTGDLVFYATGEERNSRAANSTVIISDNKYKVYVSISSHGVSFLTSGGRVDYRYQNQHYVGNINLGSTSNRGEIIYYIVNTDGSETPTLKYTWNCSK